MTFDSLLPEACASFAYNTRMAVRAKNGQPAARPNRIRKLLDPTQNIPTYPPDPIDIAAGAGWLGPPPPAPRVRARNGQPRPLDFTGRLPGWFVERYGAMPSVVSCASVLLGYANIHRHRSRDRGYHRMSFRGLGRVHPFDRKTFSLAAKLLRHHHLLDLRIYSGRFGGIFLRRPRFSMDPQEARKISALRRGALLAQAVYAEIAKIDDAQPTAYAKSDVRLTLL